MRREEVTDNKMYLRRSIQCCRDAVVKDENLPSLVDRQLVSLFFKADVEFPYSQNRHGNKQSSEIEYQHLKPFFLFLIVENTDSTIYHDPPSSLSLLLTVTLTLISLSGGNTFVAMLSCF